MSSPLKIIILGCGSSTGVPMVGNLWGNCDPHNPKNIRTRASILIQKDGKNILVDTSPDVRQQLLRHNISRLDAVLYTHYHADHVHGLNDIMLFNRLQKNLIPIYGDQETITAIKRTFAYAFPDTQADPAYPAFLDPNIIQPGIFDVLGIPITAFEQDHVSTISMGYRIGKFAYSTDVKNLSPQAFEALTGIQVWIVDALQHLPHRSHSHIEQTLSWIQYVQPKRAILTHLSCDVDYDKTTSGLPKGVEVAYDGLEIHID